MIIIGYQGIGKSTLARPENGCIDLESGNFWVPRKNEDGSPKLIRYDDWYIMYAKTACHLSNQGYTVFTSSHKVVRDEIHRLTDEAVVVFPSVKLKDLWIEKLQKRYDDTGLIKDYKALMNAKDSYEQNINELKNSGLRTYEISDIDYSLKDIVSQINNSYKKFIKYHMEDGNFVISYDELIKKNTENIKNTKRQYTITSVFALNSKDEANCTLIDCDETLTLDIKKLVEDIYFNEDCGIRNIEKIKNWSGWKDEK